MEAYIKALETEAVTNGKPELVNTHRVHLPAEAERGTTSKRQQQESESVEYKNSGLSEQQRRLIDINRQVALHRKARGGQEDQAEEMQPRKKELTKEQIAIIAANRAEAIRRTTERQLNKSKREAAEVDEGNEIAVTQRPSEQTASESQQDAAEK